MGISAAGQTVLDVLEADGPEMPVVVVARRTGLRPTQLASVLDDLHEAGLVRPGGEHATVTLARTREGGRFAHPATSHTVTART